MTCLMRAFWLSRNFQGDRDREPSDHSTHAPKIQGNHWTSVRGSHGAGGMKFSFDCVSYFKCCKCVLMLIWTTGQKTILHFRSGDPSMFHRWIYWLSYTLDFLGILMNSEEVLRHHTTEKAAVCSPLKDEYVVLFRTWGYSMKEN